MFFKLCEWTNIQSYGHIYGTDCNDLITPPKERIMIRGKHTNEYYVYIDVNDIQSSRDLKLGRPSVKIYFFIRLLCILA